MNNNNSGRSHVNSSFGKINIFNNGNGVMLSQEKNGSVRGIIELSSDEMEKLAKALLAKRKMFLPTQTLTYPKVSLPNAASSTKQVSTTNHMTELKTKHEKAYAPWLSDEEEKLKQYLSEGKTMQEIAQLLKRNEGAIKSRMKKLGLS